MQDKTEGKIFSVCGACKHHLQNISQLLHLGLADMPLLSYFQPEASHGFP